MAAEATIILKGQNQASGPINQVNSDLKQLGNQATSSGGMLSGMFGGIMSTAGGFLAANVIGGIANQITGLAGSMISGNAAFEQYEVRFGTLLGSTEAARERMAELAQFGANTPFELPGVVEADTILQGFGLHSEQAALKFGFSGEQIRTIAGDVASGTGASFSEMALLIGKFSTGATGEAIARMMELGITSRDELRSLGLEFSKSGELLSPLPQSMETVLKLMEDKYGGLMEAQSKTFGGMMSNLQDWIGGAARTLGAPTFEILKGQLEGLLAFLNRPEMQTALQSIAEVIANVVGGAIEFLQGTIQAFIGGWNMIAPAVNTAKTALQAVGLIFNSLGSEAQAWGQNIAVQLANGIMEAAASVINSLQYIGGIITEWLIPHSPPKLLPNLDTWGRDAANVYLEGWTQADFSIFDSIGSTIESTLKGLVDIGSLPQNGLVPALIGAKDVVSQALNQFSQTGRVGEEVYTALRESMGEAGAEVEKLTRLFLNQAQAQAEVTAAQRELDSVTAGYDARISGLQGRLKQLQDEEQRTANARKLAYLQEIANSDMSDADTKAAAAREIEKIQLQEQIAAAQSEKTVAVDSAKVKLDAAQRQAEQAQVELDLQQKRIKAQNEYNALLARQASMLDQVAKAGGGGGGGGGGMDKAAKEAAEAAKAQRDYAYSIADTEGKLAILQGELAKTTEGSAEYYRIKGQITQVEQQHQRELEAGGKANEAAAKAQRDFEYATADTAGKMAILQKELAATEQGSAEYWRIKTQLTSVEQQYQREVEAAAKKTDAGGKAAAGAAGGVGNLASSVAAITPKLGDMAKETTPVNQAFVDMKDRLLEAQDTIMTASPAAQMASDIMAGWRLVLVELSPAIAAISPLIETATSYIGGFVDSVKAGFEQGGIVGAIGVVLDALEKLSPAILMVRTIIEAAWSPLVEIVKSIFEIIAGFISENGTSIIQFVTDTWGRVQSIVRSLAEPIGQIVATVFGAVADFLREHGEGIKETLSSAWETITVVIDAALAVIEGIVIPMISQIAQVISDHKEQIVGILGGAWDIIKGIIDTALGVVRGIVQTVMGVVRGDWSEAWEGIKTIFGSVWDGILSILDGAIAIVLNVLKLAWDAAKFNVETGWDLIKGAIKLVWDGITSAISGALDGLGKLLSGAWETLKDGAKVAWGGIKDIITGTFDAVLGAIKGPINTIIGAVNDLIEGANTVGEALGMGSIPSIPYLKDGTKFFTGGLAWAGENGPEPYKTPSGEVGVLMGGLYKLPRGSQVMPNNQAFGQSGQAFGQPATRQIETTNNNFYLTAIVAADEGDLMDRFGWMQQARS